MIYALHDGSTTLQGGEYGKALAAYRASASRLLGSSAWRVEPVLLDDGDGFPRTGFPRRVWTLDDEQELPSAIGDAVFRSRHRRRFGPTDILVMLPGDISEALKGPDPSGQMIRCAAYDIAAVAARWAPMRGLPDRMPASLAPVLVRLACIGVALGSVGWNEPGAEQAEAGAWGAEAARRALGGRPPGREVAAMLDTAVRKAYSMWRRLRAGVCPESLSTIGAEVVAACLRQVGDQGSRRALAA